MRGSSTSTAILLWVLAALLNVGCTMPKHTVGLHDLMQQQGHDSETKYTYRCTRGAHRGSSEEHKENTLAALLAADRDRSYAFIEFDVQYSKDHKAIVFHDNRMLRTFGSLRKIEDSTFAELLTVTEGDIAEYADVMRRLKKKLNIEIKSQGDLGHDKKLVDEVMSVVTARGRQEDVLISSISGDVVKYVKEEYPDIPTGQIFWLKSSTYLHIDGLTRKLYEDIQETKADYLMMHIANLRNIDDLLKFKPEGKTIVFWDFDDQMYVVHKDMSDRIWGQSGIRNFFQLTRYKAASFCRWLNPWD